MIEFGIAKPDQMQDILNLRREVQEKEAGMSGDVTDAHDFEAIHVIATKLGELIGAGRIFHHPVDRVGDVQVGHLVVEEDNRNTGVGTELLDILEVEAGGRFPNAKSVYLLAEPKANSLYERAGYVAIDDPYGRDLNGLLLMNKVLSREDW